MRTNAVQIEVVKQWVIAAQRIVVLTGAGISTESGIPDFRGPQGVWTKNPLAEKLANIHHYMTDAEVRKAAWRARIEHPVWEAQPNAGHLALVEIERCGKLHALITQNIDGLHQAAGNAADKVIEVHGTVRSVVCMGCGVRSPMQETLKRLQAGAEDPDCRSCGGILKSATISFGQSLVPAVIARAMRCADEADLFFSIGTSLQVYPIAGAVEVAKQSGARLVILNAEPTPFDGVADAIFRQPIGKVLPLLVGDAPAPARQ